MAMARIEDLSAFIIETEAEGATPRPFPDGWQDVVFRVGDATDEEQSRGEDQSFFSASRTAAAAP